MNPGLLGGIIGSILGILGGAVGTYFSIKNTSSQREKAFMIKAAIIIWLGVGAFLILLLSLPSPYRWLLWIPYAILLPIVIITINKRQARIRQEDNAG